MSKPKKIWLPDEQRARGSRMRYADVLILGAGCAGTSLAHYLEDFGYLGKVVLIDSRKRFEREQRWCTWAKLPETFAPLVKHQWSKWSVSDKRQKIVCSSNNFVYSQIYAPDFFNYFHSKWQDDGSQVSLNLGESVQHISFNEGNVTVATDREVWQSPKVFDARGGIQSMRGGLVNHSIQQPHLNQTFIGWVVEYDRDVFEPNTAVIMDFNCDRANGISFFYVLPYSARKALVESTNFAVRGLSREAHLFSLTKYLESNFGLDYQVKAHESGRLSMTTGLIGFNKSDCYYSIGIAGGHARPSSGYAFHRIQRHTKAIAAALTENRPLPQTFAARKYNWLDAVFLSAIIQSPDLVQKSFLQMFEAVAPDSLVRFMIDESSAADDLKVINALPKFPFAKIAASRLVEELSAKFYEKRSNETFDLVSSAVDKPGFSSAARTARG
jgi:lycopene beta-cyclase